MTKRRKIKRGIVCFLITLSVSQVFGQIRPSVLIGIGLPKIPTNKISSRTPFSFTGGVELTIPFLRRNIIQIHSNGLYSIDLGSAIGKSEKFKFNLLWAGVDLGYSIRNNPINRSSVIAGFSRYYLSQIWEDKGNDLSTFGFSLGLSNMKLNAMHGTLFEIKWHLLFHPDPMPQVLTITFGYTF